MLFEFSFVTLLGLSVFPDDNQYVKLLVQRSVVTHVVSDALFMANGEWAESRVLSQYHHTLYNRCMRDEHREHWLGFPQPGQKLICHYDLFNSYGALIILCLARL